MKFDYTLQSMHDILLTLDIEFTQAAEEAIRLAEDSRYTREVIRRRLLRRNRGAPLLNFLIADTTRRIHRLWTIYSDNIGWFASACCVGDNEVSDKLNRLARDVASIRNSVEANIEKMKNGEWYTAVD